MISHYCSYKYTEAHTQVDICNDYLKLHCKNDGIPQTERAFYVLLLLLHGKPNNGPLMIQDKPKASLSF